MSIATKQPEKATGAGEKPVIAGRPYSVAQIAAKYGKKPHVVLAWIKAGELRALDLRPKKTTGKPRWTILPEDLAEFEAAPTKQAGNRDDETSTKAKRQQPGDIGRTSRQAMVTPTRASRAIINARAKPTAPAG